MVTSAPTTWYHRKLTVLPLPPYGVIAEPWRVFICSFHFRIEYYLSIRDIQTLGMLACILTHNTLPDSFKPSKPHLGIFGSKSFLYGVTPPSFDSAFHQVCYTVFSKSFTLCTPNHSSLNMKLVVTLASVFVICCCSL